MNRSASTSPGKLLAFSELYNPWVGGSVRWVAKIVQHWPGGASVLCGLTPSGSAQRTPHDGGIDVRRIRLRLTDWGLAAPGALIQYANAAVQLARACLGPNRPDLVLCGRGVPEGFIARLAAMASGVPYATLVHGEEVVACGTSAQLRRMMSAAYASAACVICNSNNSAELARGAGASDGRIVISHPGVELAEFGDLLRRQLPRDPDPVTLITVGRFDERKNHAGVLRALRRLRDDGLDLRYLVVGVGPLESELRDLCDRLDLGESVSWLVNRSDEEVKQAYCRADIFIMPAICTGSDIEGFGIVYIEAALAGLPSIAGIHGGCREAVLDRQTGLVIDGLDDDALAGAIRDLALDAEKRRTLGLTGRDRAVRDFDWPALIADLAEKVDRLLNMA